MKSVECKDGDAIEITFRGEPPAGIVVVENHAYANVGGVLQDGRCLAASHMAWVRTAAGGVSECFCCVQAAVGWDVALTNNVVIVGVHGIMKRKENYLVCKLAQTPELAGKPVLGEPPLAVSDVEKPGMYAALDGCRIGC